LSGSRNYISGGLGGAYPQAIPIDAILTYANIYGPHDLEDFERFHQVITAVDKVYVEEQINTLNQQANKKSK
jgi:hypothetical protein|tara:strand:+ start:9930 stop:10145 length:216 start_codon:yes stop_codon:yes gene_type:complete